ncbi:hypothetical protein [Paludisphaera borealis]|uniref:Uncharacterized protein n=1 Tax=Paludisphaera borealis TaxID=1387353 RepID=A0A1U7CSA7_9BACT|nr:hypothetical protein [Paludisphaera borealis]APW61779.1 hypothetical protein BSF38_03308 [Paludisphaera borealis]
MKPSPALDPDWPPKPRSPRRFPALTAVACLVLAVLMLARAESERGPSGGFALGTGVPVPIAVPPLMLTPSIDAAMIVTAPTGIDDRMILAAPAGIDDAMVVGASATGR